MTLMTLTGQFGEILVHPDNIAKIYTDSTGMSVVIMRAGSVERVKESLGIIMARFINATEA